MVELKFTKIALLLVLVCSSFCYLELNIQKFELRDSLRNGEIECITTEIDKKIDDERKKSKTEGNELKEEKSKEDSQDDEGSDDADDDEEDIDDDQIQDNQNYREICYEKDISYSFPIYLNKELKAISLDTTAPISWFKGQNCHIEGTSKRCSSVLTNLKQKISKIFKKSNHKTHHESSEYAIIEGSSELVKGIQEKSKNFSFVTKDSSRMTNLLELLMLGFYMRNEKDIVELENTNFINATEISKNLNYLCDGAISLRFDSNSEKSFLTELIDYNGNTDRFVTIYIQNSESYIAIGSIATKYSQNGYGGIEWVELKNDESYGKLPVVSDIIIENEENHLFSEIREKEYPAVISLSASYIGIPRLVMAEWLNKFNKKSNCTVHTETKYMVCSHFKEKDESKIITFEFEGKKISFLLSELILSKKGKSTLLNMKETLHDEYIILGEPLFKKYLIIFDYTNNKVGIGEKRIKSESEFINTISLIRFICFVFVFGCSFILCFLPVKRCIEMIRSKVLNKFPPPNKGETRRLKQYSPIQENPYDELNGKVREVFGEDNNN